MASICLNEGHTHRAPAQANVPAAQDPVSKIFFLPIRPTMWIIPHRVAVARQYRVQRLARCGVQDIITTPAPAGGFTGCGSSGTKIYEATIHSR
jgi:hypothetical protein